jgi:hypothetical protein
LILEKTHFTGRVFLFQPISGTATQRWEQKVLKTLDCFDISGVMHFLAAIRGFSLWRMEE